MIDGYLLNMRVSNDVDGGEGQGFDGMRDMRGGLIDGCMHTVQAVADLLAAVGATQGEVDAAIRRMDERNGYRGRL